MEILKNGGERAENVFEERLAEADGPSRRNLLASKYPGFLKRCFRRFTK